MTFFKSDYTPRLLFFQGIEENMHNPNALSFLTFTFVNTIFYVFTYGTREQQTQTQSQEAVHGV